MTQSNHSSATTTPATVYFDGGCPLCRREIAFLEKRAEPGHLRFEDVSATVAEDALGSDLDRCDALKRMHVREADGTLVSGARAFLVMWKAVPAARPFVRVLSVPPFPTLLEGAYRVFLKLRPALQWFARRGEQKAARST
ncbi:MAG: DUF393 domain-containing protein [Pseudomonadota bacterium]